MDPRARTRGGTCKAAGIVERMDAEADIPLEAGIKARPVEALRLQVILGEKLRLVAEGLFEVGLLVAQNCFVASSP